MVGTNSSVGGRVDSGIPTSMVGHPRRGVDRDPGSCSQSCGECDLVQTRGDTGECIVMKLVFAPT